MREPPLAPFRIDASGMAEEKPIFPDTPLERVLTGARSLRGTATLAGDLALGGRAIDLTGLDGQVGLVCAKALDLPPEEGAQAREELQALLTAIDRLFEAMRLTSGPP